MAVATGTHFSATNTATSAPLDSSVFFALSDSGELMSSASSNPARMAASDTRELLTWLADAFGYDLTEKAEPVVPTGTPVRISDAEFRSGETALVTSGPDDRRYRLLFADEGVAWCRRDRFTLINEPPTAADVFRPFERGDRVHVDADAMWTDYTGTVTPVHDAIRCRIATVTFGADSDGDVRVEVDDRSALVNRHYLTRI